MSSLGRCTRPAGHGYTAHGRVWVPSHLYKLVYDAGANRAWVHWVENENAARADKQGPGRPIVRLGTGLPAWPATRHGVACMVRLPMSGALEVFRNVRCASASDSVIGMAGFGRRRYGKRGDCHGACEQAA